MLKLTIRPYYRSMVLNEDRLRIVLHILVGTIPVLYKFSRKLVSAIHLPEATATLWPRGAKNKFTSNNNWSWEMSSVHEWLSPRGVKTHEASKQATPA